MNTRDLAEQAIRDTGKQINQTVWQYTHGDFTIEVADDWTGEQYIFALIKNSKYRIGAEKPCGTHFDALVAAIETIEADGYMLLTPAAWMWWQILQMPLWADPIGFVADLYLTLVGSVWEDELKPTLILEKILQAKKDMPEGLTREEMLAWLKKRQSGEKETTAS